MLISTSNNPKLLYVVDSICSDSVEISDKDQTPFRTRPFPVRRKDMPSVKVSQG
jgi:hypothetical protein